MIDFTPIIEQKINWTRFGAQFSKQDLIGQTNWLTDKILDLLADANDEDVTFTPVDDDAHDPYAEDIAEEDLSWNLSLIHISEPTRPY